jgi:TRAP-type C4-dicarboxylate transport system substrate-binding protein
MRDHKHFTRLGTAVLFAAVAATAFGASPAMSQTELRVVTALPKNLVFSKSFIRFFIEPVNADNNAGVKLKYLGGPEVVPSRKQGSAVKRGVVDMMQGPVSRYAGIIPEGKGILASNVTPDQLRANGGWDMLGKLWEERLNAKLLAWGEWGLRFNLYFTKRPKISAAGQVDLTGLKMRTSATYRPLLEALGATAVGTKVSEIYTALQRGVVQGFGWPDSGIKGIGVKSIVKFRIDPPFYRSTDMLIVNLDKWNALSRNARSSLEKAARNYERESVGWMRKQAAAEQAELVQGGMEVINLPDSVAKKYLATAYGVIWDELRKKSNLGEALKAKLYVE